MDIYNQIPIGQSRPRGQPKKIASALIHQEDGPLSSDSSDTQEFEADPSPMKKNKKKLNLTSTQPTSSSEPKKVVENPKLGHRLTIYIVSQLFYLGLYFFV